jgi:hypothetical protein
MGDYKLYCMNDAGEIARQLELDAPDDETAFNRARGLFEGKHVIEVFSLARFVGRITKDGQIVRAN